MTMLLKGHICIVTGATRGIGKGIAIQLGQAGATVYVTGRTLKKKEDSNAVGGSLEETVDEINKRGGHGIAVVCDHGEDDQVEALFDRVKREQTDRLDILVNAAYSAVSSIISENGNKKFWESPVNFWDTVNHVGLRGNYVCSVHAARLMVPRRSGLIVNITSLGGLRYLFNVPYGVGKAAVDRMSVDMAVELRSQGVSCVALCPGAVKTEEIGSHIDAGGEGHEQIEKLFENGETAEFSGKTLVSLATDPTLLRRKSGRVLLTADLAREYGLTDVDGRVIPSPRSAKFALEHFGYHRTAAFVPGFFRIPTSLMGLGGSKY